MNERDILIESYIRQRKYTFIFGLILLFLVIGVIGARMNMLVVISNGGRMPVYQSSVANANTHFTFYNFREIHYPLFADIIQTRTDTRLISSSFGDFFILIGALGNILSIIFLVSLGKEKYKYKVLSICEDYKIKCKGVKKK